MQPGKAARYWANSPRQVTVVRGKSVVQRLDIPESTTEPAFYEILRQAFGEEATSKKLSSYGAEHHASAFQVQGGARTYKKPPVVAICSKQRHVPAHAKVTYEDGGQISSNLDLHTDETPITRACLNVTLADAGLDAVSDDDDGIVNIYAIQRSTTASLTSSYHAGQTYRFRAYWQPSVQQSDRRIATYLSTLFVATKLIQGMDDRERDAF